jgi:hypothetical protein
MVGRIGRASTPAGFCALHRSGREIACHTIELDAAAMDAEIANNCRYFHARAARRKMPIISVAESLRRAGCKPLLICTKSTSHLWNGRESGNRLGRDRHRLAAHAS